MREHWQSGYEDTKRTLKHKHWLAMPPQGARHRGPRRASRRRFVSHTEPLHMTDMTDENDAAAARPPPRRDGRQPRRGARAGAGRRAPGPAARRASPTARRRKASSASSYFKELLRLQGELVKLQDWVVHKGRKVVVLFEGRDAAGKGGVIKRITQRLNPRVCRVGGAAGADRARAHPVVLPALRRPPAGGRRDRAVRPQLVQPRRRRAGDGLLHATSESRSSSARCPSSSACWCARASS